MLVFARRFLDSGRRGWAGHSAGTGVAAQRYAATALELAALAAEMNRMTGDLAVALKILRESAPAPTDALIALDRLLTANETSRA